jgi:hypothetical protein
MYGHLDKQPPFTGWHEGLSPYAPHENQIRCDTGPYATLTPTTLWDHSLHHAQCLTHAHTRAHTHARMRAHSHKPAHSIYTHNQLAPG